ncbi:hypothetical protein L6R50_20550 [Myxococcota bacterium]|nr:hypothetical protein [Myxococcota bacterium]
MARLRILAIPILAAACTPAPVDGDDDGADDGAGACGAQGLAEGDVTALLDGEDWLGTNGIWDLGGDLQIAASDGQGGLLTVTVRTDADGEAVTAVIEGGLPAVFSLGEGAADGGSAVWSPPGGSYLTRGEAQGELRIEAREVGDVLVGCFDFVAEDGEGGTVDFTEGRFRLPRF